MALIDCHVHCLLHERLSPVRPFLLADRNTNLFRDIEALTVPVTPYPHPKSEGENQVFVVMLRHDILPSFSTGAKLDSFNFPHKDNYLIPTNSFSHAFSANTAGKILKLKIFDLHRLNSRSGQIIA